MPGVSLTIVQQDVKSIECDALVVGFFVDVRLLKGLAGQLDWLLCGSLSRLVVDNRMRGALGDMALLTGRGKVPASKVFLLGLGPKKSYSVSVMHSAARDAAAAVAGAGVVRVAFEYVPPDGTVPDAGMSAFKTGITEGAGDRSLAVSLIAPDREIYEALHQHVKA
jgi:hypothetical protein